MVEGGASLALDAGAVFVPGFTGAGIIYRGAKVADKANDVNKILNKSDEVVEGIYKITTKNGDEYVGQSKDVVKRLNQHTSGPTPKFDKSEITSIDVTPVSGGKTNREIVEQMQLDKIGGKDAPNVLNKVNPLGSKRQNLKNMPLGGSVGQTKSFSTGVSNSISSSNSNFIFTPMIIPSHYSNNK